MPTFQLPLPSPSPTAASPSELGPGAEPLFRHGHAPLQMTHRQTWLPSVSFLLYNCITPRPGAQRLVQKPCHCGGEWTLDSLQTLFSMLAQRHDMDVVAKHLGKPRDQCRQELLHLRMVDRIPQLPFEDMPLSLQGGSRWSPCVQIRLCIELRDGKELDQVAWGLGRSVASCKRQLRLLTDEGTNTACYGCGRKKLYVVEGMDGVVSGAAGAERAVWEQTCASVWGADDAAVSRP